MKRNVQGLWKSLRLSSILLLSTATGLSACSDMSAESARMGASDYDYSGELNYENEPLPEDAAPDSDTAAPPDTDVDTVGTNPFVYTAHDPFSTFAADVDSASYDIFRRYMTTEGRLPDKDSVRLEEYVNFFKYNYPAPSADDDHPFAISLAAAPGIFNPETRLMRVGIQAYRISETEQRPANLVFLIDTSGSMSSADKLPLVKKLLTDTLNILNPADTVSIVTYAGSSGVALPPTPISDKSTIENAINDFTAGGSTAGGEGIELAYKQAEIAFIKDGINHVILCTDGDFNVGLSSNEELTNLIVEKRETGITLTVLGFGIDNLNDGMMESISNSGNGTYAVITSEAHASEYVENSMLSSLYFVAKDLKIQVEFNPEKVLAYRLLGYENRAIADEDFTNDVVDAGEIGSGHQVTALYEIVLAGGTVPTVAGAPDPTDGAPVAGERSVEASDLALVKVRYKQPDATTEDPASEVRMSLGDTGLVDRLEDADEDLQWAAAIAAFAEILKDSPYASAENLDAIEAIVTAKDWLDNRRAEFAELFSTARSYL